MLIETVQVKLFLFIYIWQNRVYPFNISRHTLFKINIFTIYRRMIADLSYLHKLLHSLVDNSRLLGKVGFYVIATKGRPR